MLSPFYPNVVPARESHPGVSFSLVRSYRGITSPENISHSDGHSVVECRKNKRADYTEHQESAGAWLSLQNDVLCNRLWKFKVGFCFLQLPPTEPKAWWSSSALPVYRYRVGWNRLMVEHWYLVVPPLYRYITYPSRFWMSLTIFGISKSNFQRDQEKIPLLVRIFRGDLSTGFGKLSSHMVASEN